jgi:hypothetical protein
MLLLVIINYSQQRYPLKKRKTSLSAMPWIYCHVEKIMHNIEENVVGVTITSTLLLSLCVSCGPQMFSFALTPINQGDIYNETTVGVFDTNSNPYGMTYAEWIAKWWQWAYSIPKNVNPAYDDDEKYRNVHQNDPVWFFPGSYGKDAVRECTVPSGASILFPILNSECSFAEFPQIKSGEQLGQCAKEIQDSDAPKGKR